MQTPILDEIEFGLDRGTMLIVAIFAIIFVLVFISFKIWEHIENKKSEKAAWKEWYKQKEEESHLRAENNFFFNCIEEDINKGGFDNKSPLSNNLISLYRG